MARTEHLGTRVSQGQADFLFLSLSHLSGPLSLFPAMFFLKKLPNNPFLVPNTTSLRQNNPNDSPSCHTPDDIVPVDAYRHSQQQWMARTHLHAQEFSKSKQCAWWTDTNCMLTRIRTRAMCQSNRRRIVGSRGTNGPRKAAPVQEILPPRKVHPKRYASMPSSLAPAFRMQASGRAREFQPLLLAPAQRNHGLGRIRHKFLIVHQVVLLKTLSSGYAGGFAVCIILIGWRALFSVSSPGPPSSLDPLRMSARAPFLPFWLGIPSTGVYDGCGRGDNSGANSDVSRNASGHHRR